jgi:hypothetical protein
MVTERAISFILSDVEERQPGKHLGAGRSETEPELHPNCHPARLFSPLATPFCLKKFVEWRLRREASLVP